MNTLFLSDQTHEQGIRVEDAELRTELRQRELIRRLCIETLDLALKQAEEGILVPDDELEGDTEQAESIYATLRSDLAQMLDPAYHSMLVEEHDDVYRSRAGERLKRILGWEHGDTCGDDDTQGGLFDGREECA